VSTCNKIKGSKTDLSNTKRATADYFPEGCIQGLKYRSVTDIVRPIHQIVRVERKPPVILSDLSETEVYCLSDLSELVSDPEPEM
jgi:hypothetical protein